MNYKLVLIIIFILFAFNEPLVTHKSEFTPDFLIPGNTRLTNAITAEIDIPQIERGFNSFMRRWHIAGASVAIAKDGRMVYARGFGYADSEMHEAVQPYHRFRIASISKLVTAVAVMKLCEEGAISVNDKVFGPTGILNDSLYSSPRDKRVYSITVGHLLGHKGGWTPRYGDHMFLTQVIAKGLHKELPLTTPDYVQFALGKNLHFTPGSGRSYSNLGYAILGMVVEKASGMKYADYCQKTIFEPLGIYDFALGGNRLSDRLVNEVRYYEHEAAIPKVSVYGNEEIVPASYGGNDIESLGGAGSWVATAPDLMRFLLAIDGFNFNADLLSQSTIEFMTNEKNGYAPLGWKATMGNGVWWRTGSFPGTTAMMKRMPGGISWVVLLNTSAWNGPELTNDINGLMSRIISQVREWPDVDLFKYSLPVPLKYYITVENQE